jgi:2-polyprenyl-6-methoxyphenol hydroxylase-like FAD-dependent oxidoreductase
VRALVVGGGIGGLTAAAALRQAGVDAVVFERARALEAVGAGIALASNGLRAFDRLGIGRAVREAGAVGAGVVVRRPDGSVLLDAPFRADWMEIVGIRRAALQSILLAAAGEGVVELGAECTGFRAERNRVTALLADGAEESGDLLVGADGIRSAVRARLHGEGAPLYAGYAAWRAIVRPPDGTVEPRTFSETWGPGMRFGIVDVGSGFVYWFVSENAPLDARAPHGGAKAAFLERFRDWHAPIPALIEATDGQEITRTGVFDRKPLRRWGEGRVTLLGDAAHPMTPNVGQGAGQAIEDAIVLADCLAGAEDVPATLRRYERKRMRRTAGIVRLSRRLGRLAQAESRAGCLVRDTLIGHTPVRVQRRQQERLLAYEP